MTRARPRSRAWASTMLFVPSIIGGTMISKIDPLQSLIQVPIPDFLGLPLEAPSKLIFTFPMMGVCQWIEAQSPLGCIIFLDPHHVGMTNFFHSLSILLSQGMIIGSTLH